MNVRLQFEGIRCFNTPQDVTIRPLTLLVGENSSGKSTLLALCQIASSVVTGYAHEIPFNEAPFLLGAYDQIASYRGGRAGRAKSFSITIWVHIDKRASGSVRATFVEERGQPFLESWRLSGGDISLEVRGVRGQATVTVVGRSPQGEAEFQNADNSPWLILHTHPKRLRDVLGARLHKFNSVFSDGDWANLRATWMLINSAMGQSTYAFAPIRTSPQRTYDPVTAEAKPEGSHVPMLLATLSHSSTKGQWAKLQAGLSEFGSESGLFDAIEVIRKGKKESDPFQIGVKSGGPSVNLVDVGYGVSQVLPIVVDILQRAGTNVTFLMQQPEVHLHPRAQAQLGGFFAQRANKNQRFIVETHSDYLIDRVRMEVRRGEHLAPEDVSLLYFERQKQGAVIHTLELDKQGTITNPPPGYRQFFLDEERRLLGF